MADVAHVSRLTSFAKPGEEAPRLILCTEGEDGTGKSDFALSAPKPLAYFKMDRGFEVTKEETYARLQLDRVDTAQYSYDKAEADTTDSAAIAKACDVAAWKPFRNDYNNALTKGRPKIDKQGRVVPGQWTGEMYRTIVVDSASETWETCRLARFGKLEQVPPNLYTAVNAEFRGHIIRAAFKSNCNVIFVHKIGDEYTQKVGANGKEIGVKTGRKVRKGFKEMNYQVPNRIVHTRDLTLPIPDRYQIEIQKCVNPELEGLTLGGLSFADFAQLVFPDWPAEYWTE